MSVIIKGLDIAKDKDDCPFGLWNVTSGRDECYLEDLYEEGIRCPDDCPLRSLNSVIEQMEAEKVVDDESEPLEWGDYKKNEGIDACIAILRGLEA